MVTRSTYAVYGEPPDGERYRVVNGVTDRSSAVRTARHWRRANPGTKYRVVRVDSLAEARPLNVPTPTGGNPGWDVVMINGRPYNEYPMALNDAQRLAQRLAAVNPGDLVRVQARNGGLVAWSTRHEMVDYAAKYGGKSRTTYRGNLPNQQPLS